MASPSNNFNFPRFSPPPPPPHLRPPPPPPPPHLRPPPPPPPPSPSPNNSTTIIVIVFVSFGGLFFLTFLAVALCCFLKKKKKKSIQEADMVNVDEHLKVKKVMVDGPHGQHSVLVSIDDDVHIEKGRKKNETFGEKDLHEEKMDGSSGIVEVAGTSSSPYKTTRH